jgi:hypothetical protein
VNLAENPDKRRVRLAYQPFFFQNKPAASNQPPLLFSQNKSAPAISQPNEQVENPRTRERTVNTFERSVDVGGD